MNNFLFHFTYIVQKHRLAVYRVYVCMCVRMFVHFI